MVGLRLPVFSREQAIMCKGTTCIGASVIHAEKNHFVHLPTLLSSTAAVVRGVDRAGLKIYYYTKRYADTLRWRLLTSPNAVTEPSGLLDNGRHIRTGTVILPQS